MSAHVWSEIEVVELPADVTVELVAVVVAAAGVQSEVEVVELPVVEAGAAAELAVVEAAVGAVLIVVVELSLCDY